MKNEAHQHAHPGHGHAHQDAHTHPHTQTNPTEKPFINPLCKMKVAADSQKEIMEGGQNLSQLIYTQLHVMRRRLIT